MGEIQTYKRKIEIEILNFKKPFILWRWCEGNSAGLAPVKTSPDRPACVDHCTTIGWVYRS